VVNLVYLPMALLSGLWIPLTIFPALMKNFAQVLPAYHHSQLMLRVIGMDAGSPAWVHIAVLLVQTALFLMIAQRGLRRKAAR